MFSASVLLFSCNSTSSNNEGDSGVPWNSSVTYGQLTDTRDGHVYRTVTIDGQEWMAQNLNYNTPNAVSWCYDGSADNCNEYGRLYSWAVAQAISESYNTEPYGTLGGYAQGVCPVGWHVPFKGSWDALVAATGGKSAAGKALKATEGWPDSGQGLDTYGFRILPGGHRAEDGSYGNIGYSGHFWTATEYLSNQGPSVSFYYNDIGTNNRNEHKKDGLSIRCVKDPF